MLLTILKQILIILAGIAVVIGAIALLLLHIQHEKRHIHRFWGDTPIRGQLLYLVLAFAVIGIVWFVYSLWEPWYYEKRPSPYPSVEAAVADGCLVLDRDGILAGREHWEEFLLDAEYRRPAQISIAHSNGSTISEVRILSCEDLLFYYTRNTQYVHQDSVTRTYPFLLCLTYEPPEEELYSQKVTWVLTDKPDLTAQEQHWAFADKEKDYSLETVLVEYHWKTEVPPMVPAGY